MSTALPNRVAAERTAPTPEPAGPPVEKSGSRLERLLRQGVFVVTGEAGPPKGPDPAVIARKAKQLAGFVDAVNVTDNQTAIVRMSSLAACRLLIDHGLEPVMQLVCRDRNRLALQSELFGAAALGIRNVLCLSGDHQRFGNQPDAKNVFDLDSVQLLDTARRMRDEGVILGGHAIKGAFRMLLGAAANPFADPFDFRVVRLAKKIVAGADFIQTQCIYDLDRFRRFMAMAGDRGLLDRVHVIAGVTPFKSERMAQHMATRVSGVTVPEELLARMKGRSKEEAAAEGMKICVEQIQRLREVDGVRGIHLMAIGWERKVATIVKQAGLLPRPEPSTG